MAKKITVINAVKNQENLQERPKLKVCGYARVSTGSRAQAESYATQVAYYTEKIENNPLWEFAGLYGDEAATGTKVKGREEFQAMVRACEDGDIDLILTKSVTRLARNTVECIQTIRKLKALGVYLIAKELNQKGGTVWCIRKVFMLFSAKNSILSAKIIELITIFCYIRQYECISIFVLDSEGRNGMAVINHVVLHYQPIGQEFKHDAEFFKYKKVIGENQKVSNDYFWKSNKYIGKDWTGRALDLTYLIDRPEGYLKGRLSDAEDVDYYEFNIIEYRIQNVLLLGKYNLDLQITLDHIPEGCDYNLVLYDSEGNQVGIGVDNGNGGKSITLPNWNLENKGYMVKVQAKDGSDVNPDEYYHLSFQTNQADKNHILAKQIEEMSEYRYALRKKLHDGQDATEEIQALEKIRKKYKDYYSEQLDKLHMEQAKEYLQGEKTPDKSDIKELLEKMAKGEKLTEQENGLVNIFATAQEFDTAKATAELSTTLKEITQRLESAGIDLSEYSFNIQIGADGKATVDGIDDGLIKSMVETTLKEFSEKLMDIYFTLDTDIQNMSERERYLLKAAVDLEKFLNKATNGKISFDDVKVDHGIIGGISRSLDKLLNDPGKNLTYANYQSDILAIRNYEQTQHKRVLSELNVGFRVRNGKIQIKDREKGNTA